MIAAAVGSLLTLRTLVDSSPTARAFSVVSAFCVSFSGTPALVEWVGATDKQERIMALGVAFLGVNLLAGLATFAEKWRQDPQAAATWLFSLWRGGPAAAKSMIPQLLCIAFCLAGVVAFFHVQRYRVGVALDQSITAAGLAMAADAGPVRAPRLDGGERLAQAPAPAALERNALEITASRPRKRSGPTPTVFRAMSLTAAATEKYRIVRQQTRLDRWQMELVGVTAQPLLARDSSVARANGWVV